MKKRNNWYIIGILFLLSACILSTYNIYKDVQAKKQSDAVLKVLDGKLEENIDSFMDYKIYPKMEMPTIEVDGNYYIGTLEIPCNALSLPIMSELDAQKLNISPCRYYGSAYTDDMVIGGHGYQNHFDALRDLKMTDVVIFTDVCGNVFTYEVVDIEVLAKTDVDEMINNDWDLTLFTCTYTNRERFTIRCERIEK